jgi:branched-chain amino acid transport system ATP-binding protein
MRVISGLIAPRAGTLAFEGKAIGGPPAYEIVGHGIAHVPEGRRIFPALSVADNLKMGAFLPAARATFAESLARVHALFPALAERRTQRAGQPLGRRAADARHRARAHVAAQADPARRAVDGPAPR